MIFTLKNISPVTIPPNNIMTLNINGEYTIDDVSYNLPILDTVLLITDSLRLGQSLHVEAKNISLPEAISNIFFTYNVQAIFENTKYNQTFYQSLQYLKQADRAEDYFNAQYMYNQIENVWDKKSNVSRTFAYINFKLCYPYSFLFETVFENGTSSKSIFETKSVTPSRYFSDVRLDVENPDLSMFEDKSEVIIPNHFILCLLESPEAHFNFEKMSSTSQKQYVDYVYGAKSLEAQARRMTKSIEKLEKGLKYHEKDEE